MIAAVTTPTPTATVLVVDDDPAIRFLLFRVLLEEGYRVETAADGKQALDAIAKRLPDLILLDVDMPGINGLEVCRRLKESPRTRLVPVVIVTAQGDLSRRLNAWDDGADDFLAKPFHLSVADVYDSLASDRPYRASIPHAGCLTILRENAGGGGLDPALVARVAHLHLARPVR